MILFLLAAAAGLYLYGRMSPDASQSPGGFGVPGLPPPANIDPGTELGIAEDGSFVIVQKVASFRPNNLGEISLPPSQPSVSASYPGSSGVGWMPPSVGCAPGKQCCTDCKTATVRVGEGVGISAIDGLAAILAQRIHLGDLRAAATGAQILNLALTGNGRDRYVGEALVLALEQYQGPGGQMTFATPREAFPARLRVAVDNPDYVPEYVARS